MTLAGHVFYKMSGSGNDFVVLDGRHTGLALLTPEVVRALCDRRQGVGADGVILLDPGTAPPGAHFFFHFWNSDGSLGAMCGNGALCATRLATLIELAHAGGGGGGGGEVRFATRAGLHRGRVVGERAELYLPDCPRPTQIPEVRTAAGEEPAWLASPSMPHLVVPVADVAAVDLPRRGPLLRSDPGIGPEGANVNWVAPRGDGSYRMRTYERGVEGETLACGTGAVACALVLDEVGLAGAPLRFWTTSGLPLDIGWRRDGDQVTGITLTGQASLVYRGVAGRLLSDS